MFSFGSKKKTTPTTPEASAPTQPSAAATTVIEMKPMGEAASPPPIVTSASLKSSAVMSPNVTSPAADSSAAAKQQSQKPPATPKAAPAPSSSTAAGSKTPAQQSQRPAPIRDPMDPAVGGGRRTAGGVQSPLFQRLRPSSATSTRPKTEEEKKKDEAKAKAKAEKERIRLEREKKKRLLSRTGVGEIGSRITELLYVNSLADQLTIRAAPSSVSKELHDVEEAAKYKSWLRGMLSLLSVLSFLSAMVDIQMQTRMPNHYINMVLCLSGMVCVVNVYRIKAKQAGVQNPLYGNRASLFHSPYLGQMCVELCLWVFTPPYLVSVLHIWWLASIDFISFFRLYNIALWLNNRTYLNRAFCRAMSAFSGIKLTTGYYMRTAMVYRKMETSVITVVIAWVACALAFSKAEGRSYWDSLYFTFVTAATIGYGDISPVTVVGRMSAFVAWIFGLLILGWCVSIFQMYLNLSEHEKNLYILFRTNELSAKIRNDSARLIQMTWRIHMRNKLTRKHTILTDMALWRMAKLTAQLKDMRREFRMHVHAYTQVIAAGATDTATNDNDSICGRSGRSMSFVSTGAGWSTGFPPPPPSSKGGAVAHVDGPLQPTPGSAAATTPTKASFDNFPMGMVERSKRGVAQTKSISHNPSMLVRSSSSNNNLDVIVTQQQLQHMQQQQRGGIGGSAHHHHHHQHHHGMMSNPAYSRNHSFVDLEAMAVGSNASFRGGGGGHNNNGGGISPRQMMQQQQFVGITSANGGFGSFNYAGGNPLFANGSFNNNGLLLQQQQHSSMFMASGLQDELLPMSPFGGAPTVAVAGGAAPPSAASPLTNTNLSRNHDMLLLQQQEAAAAAAAAASATAVEQQQQFSSGPNSTPSRPESISTFNGILGATAAPNLDAADLLLANVPAAAAASSESFEASLPLNDNTNTNQNNTNTNDNDKSARSPMINRPSMLGVTAPHNDTDLLGLTAADASAAVDAVKLVGYGGESTGTSCSGTPQLRALQQPLPPNSTALPNPAAAAVQQSFASSSAMGGCGAVSVSGGAPWTNNGSPNAPNAYVPPLPIMPQQGTSSSFMQNHQQQQQQHAQNNQSIQQLTLLVQQSLMMQQAMGMRLVELQRMVYDQQQQHHQQGNNAAMTRQQAGSPLPPQHPMPPPAAHSHTALMMPSPQQHQHNNNSAAASSQRSSPALTTTSPVSASAVHSQAAAAPFSLHNMNLNPALQQHFNSNPSDGGGGLVERTYSGPMSSSSTGISNGAAAAAAAHNGGGGGGMSINSPLGGVGVGGSNGSLLPPYFAVTNGSVGPDSITHMMVPTSGVAFTNNSASPSSQPAAPGGTSNGSLSSGTAPTTVPSSSVHTASGPASGVVANAVVGQQQQPMGSSSSAAPEEVTSAAAAAGADDVDDAVSTDTEEAKSEHLGDTET